MLPGKETQQEYWKIARENKGWVEMRSQWWDSDGSRAKRKMPETFTESKIRDLLSASVLMQVPTHYYKSCGDVAWRRLAVKVEASLVKHEFSATGARVDGVIRLNLFAAYGIASAEEFIVLDRVFQAWSDFAVANPSFALGLRVGSIENGRRVLISRQEHPKCDKAQSDAMEAKFRAVMAPLEADLALLVWLKRYRQQSHTRGFAISEDIWFGQGDSPTTSWWYENRTGANASPSFG